MRHMSTKIFARVSLPLLYRSCMSRLRRTITVLMYHGIVADDEKFHAWTLVRASNFIEQIQYLMENFHIVSMEDALNPAIFETDPLPKVVITLDDGLRDNLTEAFPILQQFRIPATIFVTTEAVQRGKKFWWDQIVQAIESTKATRLDLRDLNLRVYDFHPEKSPSRQWGPIQRLLTDLKRLGPGEREKAVSRILQRLDLRERKHSSSAFDPLSPEDVMRLSSSPLITIGSHTHCHSILTQLTPPEIRKTIQQSLGLLREWANKTIAHFSYPNGDYNRAVLDIVKEFGMKTAVTTRQGRWTTATNFLEIPRIGIGGYDTAEVFKARVSGVFDIIQPIRRLLPSCTAE